LTTHSSHDARYVITAAVGDMIIEANGSLTGGGVTASTKSVFLDVSY